MFQDFELTAEKFFMALVLSIFLLSLGTSASLDTFGGEVVQAILTGESLSSRWVGFAGDVDGSREENISPITSVSAGNQKAGEVTELNLEGKKDKRHYFVAVPFNGSDFDGDRLRNISLNDLDAGGIFDEEDFPVFYPDSLSYSAMSDSPEETFKSTGTVTLLNNTYSTVKTDLRDNVPFHVVGYEYEGDVKPIFASDISDYTSCHDGTDCDHQFLVPNIGGRDYYFYMIPETKPVKITTYIDGVESDTFPYSGRPYRLNITTRSIFEDYKLVDRPIKIVEDQGNNLFTPAVASTSYQSSAKIETSTQNGYKEFLFSPTSYSSPSGYNLSINVLTGGGKVAGVEYLTVENGNIVFTTEGPNDKDLGEYSTSYKKGVNRLTPIANCVFKNVNNGIGFELTPSSGTSSYTLVRGVPYIMNTGSSSAEFYRLSEPGSHLVMSPSRSSDFGETIHMSSDSQPYSNTDEVVFTPTIPKAEDKPFTVDLLDSQGNLLQEINISVKGSTCGTNNAGSFTSLPNSNDFKKRINSITPVLNSLFVAGT